MAFLCLSLVAGSFVAPLSVSSKSSVSTPASTRNAVHQRGSDARLRVAHLVGGRTSDDGACMMAGSEKTVMILFGPPGAGKGCLLYTSPSPRD